MTHTTPGNPPLSPDPDAAARHAAAWKCIRTVLLPPDIVAEQRRSADPLAHAPFDNRPDPYAAARHADAWRGIRTIILSSDTVAVQRRSPDPLARAPFDNRPDLYAVARHADAWRGIRTILVPPDIVGVPRRSPVRKKGRTPLRWHPDGGGITTRAGGREWFGDRVFVEAQQGNARVGYGTAVALHVCFGVAVAAFSLARPARPAGPVQSGPLLFIRAMVSAVPSGSSGGLLRPRTARVEPPAAAAPPPLATILDAKPADAPTEAPAGIAPETGVDRRAGAVEGGVAGGAPGGVAGGVAGGVPGGVVGGVVGGALPTSVRVGAGMEAPRKIKDVRPVYPESALPGRAQGKVVVEVTIGPDGKVQDAKILFSMPLLDQAALDAVRQWEYVPPLLNGVPVAVIITVVVNFAMR